MRLTEITYTDALPIDGYGPGFFRIGGKVFHGAVMAMPSGPAPWGGYDDSATLIAAADQIDVLFVGTGAEIAALPAGLRSELENSGIGVEIMASPTAARSYNVLLSEGRRVAAALLPV